MNNVSQSGALARRAMIAISSCVLFIAVSASAQSLAPNQTHGFGNSQGDLKHMAHLYVLVPMFSVDHDTNPKDAMPCPNGGRPTELCGPALGNALTSLFGFIPEAWKTTVNPAITTQCPDPNNPTPGICTMHASSVDLSVLLHPLRKTGPPTPPIFVPTPNHSHVVDNSRVNTGPIWWEVRPILVVFQSDWPTANASSGITSSRQRIPGTL